MSVNKERALVGAATVAAGLVIALTAYLVGFLGGPSREGPGRPTATAADTNRSPYGASPHTSPDPLTAQSVELSASDVARAEFPQDVLPIHEIDLFGAQ